MTPERLASDEGTVASQLAVLMPAVLLLIMLAVQFGLWAHSTQLATAAADTAARQAALPGATDDDGTQAAAGMLDQAGNLTEITITIDRQPTVINVTVAGVTPQVVPGFRWATTGRATVPIEQFVNQSQR